MNMIEILHCKDLSDIHKKLMVETLVQRTSGKLTSEEGVEIIVKLEALFHERVHSANSGTKD